MYKLLAALALANFVDAISYMVVAPSLVFYIQQLGGTKEQYGVVLGSFSFASFCVKPVFGTLCDKIGFRIPYMISFSVACSGAILYWSASIFRETPTGVYMVLCARMLGGVGAANSALAFAYIAKSIPNNEFTRANSLLSMARLMGTMAGPAMNAFLANVDVASGHRFYLDPFNSVGLVLIVSNILAISSIYMFLEEPDDSSDNDEGIPDMLETQESAVGWAWMRNVLSAKILVPMLSLFTVMANFQVIETSFAPAAYHALGWGTVQTSSVFGLNAVLIFFNTMLVFNLSKHKVRDEVMLSCGMCSMMSSLTMIYVLWKEGSPSWHFYVPILFNTASATFIGAPTRSIFAKNVAASYVLRRHKATMQALLSMAVSVAGFTAPPFVATYCLRHPAQVEASPHGRELSPWTLFAPTLSLCSLVGLFYITRTIPQIDEETATKPNTPGYNGGKQENHEAHETSSLLHTNLEVEEA